jgi:hypothetical protein
MQLAEGSGQAQLEADVLMNAQMGLSDPLDLPLQTRAAQRLRMLAYRNGDINPDTLHLWEATYLDFNVAMINADREGLDRAVVNLREITPFVKERPRTFGMAMVEGAYAHATGDLESAAAHAEHMLQIGLSTFDPSWAIALYSALKLSIEIDQGTVRHLASTVDRLLVDQPEFRTWHSLAALIALDAGDLARASGELGEVVRNNGSLIARDHSWGPTVMSAARVAHGLRDTQAASLLYELVAPQTGFMSWSGAVSFGPFDLALSLLASTMGDEELARKHRELSNSFARRLGCVSYER